MCIYIYIIIYKCVETDTADGIGAPGPNPRDLANRCV